MSKYFLVIVLVFATCLNLFAADKQKNGTLILTYNNLQSDLGKVYVKLYDTTSEKFPNTKFAILIKQAKIENGKASIKIENLPYGIYAFSSYHDENDNGIMDTNLFHIPKEGYTFSNNAKGVFGPPSFEEAGFMLDKEELHVELKLRY